MTKAFVDTTVLTNILLKNGDIKKTSQNALKRYSASELPAYAIKEFKAGPLSNWVWFHNKLVQCSTFSKAMEFVHKAFYEPYKRSTVLEAIATNSNFSKITLDDLVKHYGGKADLDIVQKDQYRAFFAYKIKTAWKKRRTITTSVSNNLSCYFETSPTETNGIISVKPDECDKGDECCLKSPMLKEPQSLRDMGAAIEKITPIKKENEKRVKVLKELVRLKDKYSLFEKDCRNLGDAIIAFLAPLDSVILTTNEKDFKPLADAISKKVETP